MTLSMHQASAPIFLRALKGLSTVLSKAAAHAEAKGFEPAALLQARLYPDMFPLTRQVQLACDFGARAAARLAGDTPRSFPDTETSFAELLARIADVRAYMASFPVTAYAGAEVREVTIKARGQDMTMTGLAFLTLYALPQFHFHATTAYNVLRHNGVDLGKMDYMGAV